MAKNKDSYLLICNDVRKRSFCFFNDLRNRKELCDVTFRAGGETIYAHRIIIIAVMPYFRGVLSCQVSPKEEEGIQMPDIEPNALKCLIDFAYSCELNIDRQNVMTLLSSACFLGVDEVQQACCEFLADNLEPENVLSTRELAAGLNCAELLKSVDYFATKNFKEISETDFFVNYPLPYVKELVSKEDLSVDSEENVLEAVLKWIKYSPEDRQDKLPELMQEVRLSQLEPKYLAQIVKREEVIRNSLLCRDLIDEAKHYRLFPDMRESSCNFSTEPRRSAADTTQGKANAVIYLVRGKLTFTTDHLDLLEKKKFTPKCQVYFDGRIATVYLHNKIYFFVHGYAFECVPRENVYLRYYCPMPTPRLNSTPVPFEDKIYVCGGYHGTGTSGVVELFDPITGKWAKVSSMPTGRRGSCAVTIGEHVFVLGGRNESAVYSCTERYHPATDTWRKMSPMNTPRYDAGAAELNGKIYICGGYTNGTTATFTATTEVYDLKIDEWKFVSSMKTNLCRFTVHSYTGKLYATGGEAPDGKYLPTLEIYDPKDNEWTSETDIFC